MIGRLFDFMIHSGIPFYESVGMFLLLIVLSVAFVVIGFNSSKRQNGLLYGLFLVILVGSVGFVWGSMVLMGDAWVNVDDALFEYWPPFDTILAMYLCTIVMTIIPLAYNYMMRSSKTVMAMNPDGRRDFLGTNSSWMLVRIATYHFMFATALVGVFGEHYVFPRSAELPTIGQKLLAVVLMVSPFLIGLFIGTKIIARVSFLSYSWKIPDTPDYKADK